ncbi:MAG: PilZ domain-containing protein [Candidatus Omnitrophota bacterium]
MMEESNGFREKRAFTRFPVNIPLTYSRFGAQQKSQACTRDISAQGLCMLVDPREVLTPGASIEVCLEMEDNEELIYLKGRVVWSGMLVCDKQRVGIQLDGPKLKAISMVLRVLKSKERL